MGEFIDAINPSAPRGHLATEQRQELSSQLDQGSVADTVTCLHQIDAQVQYAIAGVLPTIADLVEMIVAGMKQGGRLIYVGAGTSGRLGVLDASECPPTFQSAPEQVIGLIAGGDSALRKSSEGKEDNPEGAYDALRELEITPQDVLVGIAAGGTTPYVWGAINFAKQQGATAALLCCVSKNALLKSGCDVAVLDCLLCVETGPEAVAGSTRMKAGTATKQVLNMLTTATMVHLGKVWGNLMVDMRASNAKLYDRALRLLEGQLDCDRDTATVWLEKADKQVKVALVMAKKNLSRDEAKALLGQYQQRLQLILGQPK